MNKDTEKIWELLGLCGFQEILGTVGILIILKISGSLWECENGQSNAGNLGTFENFGNSETLGTLAVVGTLERLGSLERLETLGISGI